MCGFVSDVDEGGFVDLFKWLVVVQCWWLIRFLKISIIKDVKVRMINYFGFFGIFGCCKKENFVFWGQFGQFGICFFFFNNRWQIIIFIKIGCYFKKYKNQRIG